MWKMNLLKKLIKYVQGSQQENAGVKTGRYKANSDLYEQAKADAKKELTGQILLNELQNHKNNIGSDCPKCERTRRKYCRKCQRTLKGLDHLAGRIAKNYTNKVERWKENG